MLALTGTLTFVLADIEGSTRLAQQLGEARFARLIDEYRTLLGETFASRGGTVQCRADEVLGVFDRAGDAVAAAVEAQFRVRRSARPEGAILRVRMGVHAGEASVDGGEYTGLALHRTARICAAGHGGQVLLSLAARELVQALPAGCSLLDLGVHALRDIEEPEHLTQVCHVELPRAFPPLRGLEPRLGPWSRPLTSLIGRDEELAEVSRLLVDGEVRLVTVTGPGGVGKTRFAVDVAAAVAGHFTSGVAFVALAALSDEDLVVPAVANAVGLREAGSVDLAGLVQLLRRQELLLLLDNFEQVVDAAPTVMQVLGSCPGVKALVTSRGSLRVGGEHVFPLPPLAVPHPAAGSDIRVLASVPAVALFVERARGVRPDFDPSHDAETVATLCRRLEGLPLAVELAAASLRLLTPEAMLRRLEVGVGEFVPAGRDAPDRHASLRRAIDWSYELLSGPQQELFRRLSVFAGGCTLEAAEAVAGWGSDFLEDLDGIVSQSLVRVEPSDGNGRLAWLETIAEYGREKLAVANEIHEVRQAHASYFLQLAERERQAMRSVDRERSVRRLEQDHDNLRAALAHLMAVGPPEDASRLAAALAPFWQDHGHLDEGGRWLGLALRVCVDAQDDVRMPVVLGAAMLAYEDERIEEAAQLAESALAHFRVTGDVVGCIESLEILAAAHRFHGDHKVTAERYSEAIRLAEGIGDQWLVAHLRSARGGAAWSAGDYEGTARAQTASLAAFRSLGDEQGESFALWSLGSADVLVGRLSLGIRRIEEAVLILRRGRHRRQLARALWNLGLAYVRKGEPGRAEPVLIEAAALFRDVKLGRHVSAVTLAFAELAAALGDPDRAARLLGATQAQWDSSGWQPPVALIQLWEQCARTVRGQMRQSAFTAALSEGRALTLDEALEEAVHPRSAELAGLTAREVDILQLVAQGLTNAQIAERLYLSVRTVHAHLRSLYPKLGVRSRTAAVQRASELGVVSLASRK